MKFGVRLPNNGRLEAFGEGSNSPENLVKVAKKSDDLGYYSVWVNDFLVTSRAVPHMLYESLLTLTYVASQTTDVMLGTAAIIVPLRNPVVLAKQTATLDDLSDGRFICGVCAGYVPPDFEAVGVEFQGRGKIIDEGLMALKELWTKSPASFEGKYIRFKDVNIDCKPKQKPHPPIWVMGGTKYTLQRTARLGEGWTDSGAPLSSYEANIPKLEKYVKEAGKDFGKIEISAENHVSIAKTYDKAYKRIEPAVKSWAAAFKKPIEEAKKAFFIGTPREVSDVVEKFIQAGVTHFELRFHSDTLEDHLSNIEMFAREVMPSFT